MTDETPRARCAAGDIDPQDWFIRADGKQYSDEDFLTELEIRGLTRSVLARAGETAEEHQARVATALRAARADRKRKALIRRRKAREACLPCPMRDDCLRQAIDRREPHGTWGGVYEEDLQVLYGRLNKTG